MDDFGGLKKTFFWKHPKRVHPAFPSPIQLKIPAGDCWHKVPGGVATVVLIDSDHQGNRNLPNLLSCNLLKPKT